LGWTGNKEGLNGKVTFVHIYRGRERRAKSHTEGGESKMQGDSELPAKKGDGRMPSPRSLKELA